MPYYRSGVCHGTCLRTCRANPSAPAPPLRSGSSVRRRMAVILEPTVLAAALITSRRYALSRFLLEARNRARAPLSAPSSLSEALRPIGLRFPLALRLVATRIECRLFGRSTAEMFLLASGTRRRFLSRHSQHSIRFHEKASQEVRLRTPHFFGGSLNVMLPSALFMGLLLTRCMLGSVVGLQPPRRTR